MADVEAKGNADHRRENLAGVSGRVIELGVGMGLNFQHYRPEVTELVAAEPEPYMRQGAERAAAEALMPVTVVDWLEELSRVIRPGGELRYYEHVWADTRPLARVQSISDRIGVSRLLGNEHFGRRTELAIRAAGFKVERERRFRFKPSPLDFISAPHVLGVARRP